MTKNLKNLKSLLKKINEPKIILLNFKNLKNIDENISKIIKILINEKKQKGIYIAIRNPSSYMLESFIKLGIDSSNLLFIDVISKYIFASTPGISIPAEVRTEEKNNIILLKSPLNLTELGIVFLEISASFRETKKCFLIFDSIDTLLLYIEKEKFLKFFHFLVSKLKLLKIIGIFFQLSEKKDIVNDLKHFVDEIFYIKN